MSHTSILDKIRRLFVNPPSLKVWCARSAFPSSWRQRSLLVSRRKDCQESDFDRQRFVNIAIQMIAQFFETPDAFQDFSCAESACQCGGFFSCTRQTTLRYTIPGPKNIRPPRE